MSLPRSIWTLMLGAIIGGVFVYQIEKAGDAMSSAYPLNLNHDAYLDLVLINNSDLNIHPMLGQEDGSYIPLHIAQEDSLAANPDSLRNRINNEFSKMRQRAEEFGKQKINSGQTLRSRIKT